MISTSSAGRLRGRALTSALFSICLAAALWASPSPAQANSKYAALVVDQYSGKVLYARNPDDLRYPASLTKMMTLYLLFDQLDAGRYTLASRLSISRHAASMPPTKLGLKPGSTISVENAILSLVTHSSNDIAAAIGENIGGSETAFARLMTAKAHQLGMTRTTYKNASGLPARGQMTTARDQATLGARLQRDHPKYYHYFDTKYFTFHGHRYGNHNKLVYGYAGTDGIKTGYTHDSGFNLVASVHRSHKHLIGVVLGGRSGRSRNQHMRAILNQSWPKAYALADGKKIFVAGPAPVPHRNPVKYKLARRELEQLIAAGPDQVATVENGAPHLRAAVASADDITYARPVQVASNTQAVPQPARSELRPRVVKVHSEPIRVPASEPQQEEHKQVFAVASLTPTGAKEEEHTDGPYHVQVGAFVTPSDARAALNKVRMEARTIVQGHPPKTVEFKQANRSLYRARFAGFTQSDARSTCTELKNHSINCIVMPAN